MDSKSRRRKELHRLITASRRYSIPVAATTGLVVCQLCGRIGPTVPELMTQPVERQVAALGSGWRYDEEDRWMCKKCHSEP